MEQQNLEKLREIIEEFFKKMCFAIEIASWEQKEETLVLGLTTEEPRVLIGERGQTLFEIQHLLKAILRKKIKENFYLDLDINDYKKKKIERLKDLALFLAKEAILTKQEKELPPMSAAERRIIHLELASRKDITTKSFGEGPDRRIVISPSS